MTAQNRTDLRSAYLYLICLVTLVMVIFAAVNLMRNVVELAYPDPGAYAFEPAYGPEGRETLSPEDRSMRQQAVQDSQRRQAVIGLVGAAAMLAIAGPAYLYHWRRVQQEVRTREDTGQLAPSDAAP